MNRCGSHLVHLPCQLPLSDHYFHVTSRKATTPSKMGSGSAAAPAQALDERDSICRAPLAAPAGWVGASMLRLRCASIRPVCAAIPRSIIRPSRGVSTSGVTPRKSVSALAQVGLHHSAPTCVRAVASPQLCVSALPVKFPSQSSAKPVRRMATIKERISAGTPDSRHVRSCLVSML